MEHLLDLLLASAAAGRPTGPGRATAGCRWSWSSRLRPRLRVLPGLEELLDEHVGGDVADDHHLLLLRVYVRLVHPWIRIRGAGASVQQQYTYTKEKDQTTEGEKAQYIGDTGKDLFRFLSSL